MVCGIGNIHMSTVLEQVVIPTFSPGGATQFDFVVIYISKLHTRALVMTACGVLTFLDGLYKIILL